jgi:hypothetical protein
MSRRIGILQGLAIGLMVLCGAFASPALAGRPGSACTKQSVSALDQYCENIPSAAGPQTPLAGTPAVGNGLPPAVVHALTTRHGTIPLAVRRQLRSLPAAIHHARRIGNRDSTGTVAAANIWSLSLSLILVLVGAALALLAVAGERWRRHRVAAGAKAPAGPAD